MSNGRRSWPWLSCCSPAVCGSKTSTRTLTPEFTLRKSPFPSSRLARLPWGLAGVNNKMCFWSRGAGEQGRNGGAGRVGNSKRKPSKRKEERGRERDSLCCLGLSWEEEKFDLRGSTYCLKNLPVPHTFRRSLCRSLQWRTEVLILPAAGNWISFPANEAFHIRSLTLWHRAELSDEMIWSLRQQ